jgi:hypothetical protein
VKKSFETAVKQIKTRKKHPKKQRKIRESNAEMVLFLRVACLYFFIAWPLCLCFFFFGFCSLKKTQ